MRSRFARLSIHRQLVAIALTIAAAALVVAVTGLIVVDIWLFRVRAEAETHALAQVMAENVVAAVQFDDEDAADDTLRTLRFREAIQQACLYLPDGGLFAGYARDVNRGCPATAPQAPDTWRIVTGTGNVPSDAGAIGQVIVHRDMTDVPARVLVTMAIGGTMLVLGGGVALLLANRINRTVSRPIADLARAARRMGSDGDYVVPDIAAPPGELGELVAAFTAMTRRVGSTNATLLEANDALRHEVEERRRMEVERQHLLERERHASRLKDEFLAAVSHELRTPLNAILGWSHILSSGPTDSATTARALASIARNARTQTRVIDDLIDISRIVTGKLQLQMRAVDLRAVVEAAIEVVRPVAAMKGVTLQVELPPVSCPVRGDGDRLQQVLWNLLTNGIKFTPEGGSVHLSVANDGAVVTVRVRDTGVGMTEEFLPHVFERFRQADGSMTREHGGLGLGMAIARELTDLHGGTIEAASAGPGLGSDFIMTLPARSSTSMSHEPGVDEDTGSRVPSLRGVRVLAVDDNIDALDVLTTTLAAAGAHVSGACSGAEALSQWTVNHSDVLLCDLAMPHMDGYEVLRRIREIDAAAGRLTPAIAVTAHASEDQQARSVRAGFQQHVAKPYQPADLVRAVAASLEHR